MREHLTEPAEILPKVWAFFLISLYLACFLNEYHYPGFRDDPLPGEEIFWQIERLLFWGLLLAGFLADVAQMQTDRSKIFRFLTLSLVLGGLSSVIGAYQFRFMALLAGENTAAPF